MRVVFYKRLPLSRRSLLIGDRLFGSPAFTGGEPTIGILVEAFTYKIVQLPNDAITWPKCGESGGKKKAWRRNLVEFFKKGVSQILKHLQLAKLHCLAAKKNSPHHQSRSSWLWEFCPACGPAPRVNHINKTPHCFKIVLEHPADGDLRWLGSKIIWACCSSALDLIAGGSSSLFKWQFVYTIWIMLDLQNLHLTRKFETVRFAEAVLYEHTWCQSKRLRMICIGQILQTGQSHHLGWRI